MDIRLLSEDIIKKVMPMTEAIKADKEALSLYSAGRATIPLRANVDIPEHLGQSLYMYGYVPDAQASGVKIVSVYPKNIELGKQSVPATMVTLDAQTGEVNAILDGTYLTRLRTGAVAGAATDELARKDAKIFALFGTGGQAETQLEAVLTVRDIELVKVFDISSERCQDFCARMQEHFGDLYKVKIVPAKSSDEAVEDADIITSVTTSKVATFDAARVKPGCHVNGIGSYTPDMAELPQALFEGAQSIFVDTKDGALNECGSLMQPLKAGRISETDITGELGELILGNVSGRVSDTDISVFVTTGTAVLDLVCAERIRSLAEAAHVGNLVTL